MNLLRTLSPPSRKKRCDFGVTLDPDLRSLVDRVTASGPVDFDAMAPEDFRRAFLDRLTSTMPTAPIRLAAIEDRTLHSRHGPVPLRVYRPPGASAGTPKPGLVFFHGGGWVVGDIAGHDGLCRPLCAATGAVVLSVDYRLAPAHPFPAALDDAVAALEWVAAGADALGIDPQRLGVAGDSAGANLAAALALWVRDSATGPALRVQVLVGAPLDLACRGASVEASGAGHLLTSDALRWMCAQYLAGHPADDPYASPLCAGDLGGLPAAVVVTAEFDPVRDDARTYASRLARAGVPVTLLDFPGLVHGFMGLRGLSGAADTASARVWEETRALLHAEG
jgi:acetyl esterase